MSGIWLASYLVLWVFVLLQATIIFALMRQLGLRVLNTAEAVSHDGLEIGTIAPVLERGTLTPNGSGPTLNRSLVVFASRTCQPCRALVPHLNAFAKQHSSSATVSIVFDEREEAALETAKELGVSTHSIRVVAVRGAHEHYKVRVTPFAFVLDARNRIVAKGLVNNGDGLKWLWRQVNPEHGRVGSDLASSIS